MVKLTAPLSETGIPPRNTSWSIEDSNCYWLSFMWWTELCWMLWPDLFVCGIRMLEIQFLAQVSPLPQILMKIIERYRKITVTNSNHKRKIWKFCFIIENTQGHTRCINLCMYSSSYSQKTPASVVSLPLRNYLISSSATPIKLQILIKCMWRWLHHSNVHQ